MFSLNSKSCWLHAAQTEPLLSHLYTIFTKHVQSLALGLIVALGQDLCGP